MADGWKCPVCSRGVAPTERHCDHGNSVLAVPQINIVPTSQCSCSHGMEIYCGNTVCPRKRAWTSPTIGSVAGVAKSGFDSIPHI